MQSDNPLVVTRAVKRNNFYIPLLSLLSAMLSRVTVSLDSVSAWLYLMAFEDKVIE